MTSELARQGRRLGDGLMTRQERLPRPVERRVSAAHHVGLESAARIHAAAYVTHVALTHAATLSAEEARLIELMPLGESRYRAIVDQFTGVVCTELSRFGW